MKLLVLTSRFPYPIEKGDKLRAYHQIRVLAQRHEVVLVSLHEGEVSAEAYQALAAHCARIHLLRYPRWWAWSGALRALMAGRPAQVGYFHHAALHRRVQALIAQEAPDHIYCQLLRMAEYVRGGAVPATLDYMDTFSVGMARRAERSPRWQRPLLQLESQRLRRYEAEIFGHFQHHSIISQQDRALLSFPKAGQITVVPNGIDLTHFAAQGEAQPRYEVVFVGNMGYFPNVEAARFLAREIMPLVWERLPEARLLLAGARPSAEVQALGRDPRITVSGWVEDIRDAYRDGQLFVAPLRTGSGQQNKILEAMALGRPCLTTPLVNNAIGAEPGREILLADGAAAFAQQIHTVLGQPGLRQAIGRAGEAFVRQHFSWEDSTRKLEALWNQ